MTSAAGLPLAAIQRADSGIVKNSASASTPVVAPQKKNTPSQPYCGASQLVTCPAIAPPAEKPSMMIVTARALAPAGHRLRC